MQFELILIFVQLIVQLKMFQYLFIVFWKQTILNIMTGPFCLSLRTAEQFIS